MTYYGPDWLKPYAMATWYPAEWLSGTWTKNDQKAFDNLYDLNILGIAPYKHQFDTILNSRNWDLYSAVNDIGYGDIKDPRKFDQAFGSHSLSYALQISSNVKRLYH